MSKSDQLNDPLLEGGGQSANFSRIFKITKQQLMNLFETRKGKGHAAATAELDSLRGVNGVTAALASDATSGIIGDERDLQRRAKMFGKNSVPLPQQTTWLSSLKDIGKEMQWVIAAGTALLAALGGWIQSGAISGALEGLGLVLFIIVTICILATVDFCKDRRFIQLQELLKNEELSVIRGRAFQTRSVCVWSLVVGDVILLEAGSHVPADCLIIPDSDENLKVEEPVREPRDSVSVRENGEVFLMADSTVRSGRAKALVCVVGPDSTREDEKKLDLSKDTLLEQKLQRLNVQFSWIAIITTAVIGVMQLIFFFVQLGKADNWFTALLGELLKDANFLAILAIASIPEGLPLVIQLSLAFSIMTMYSKDNVLVKELDAPETMGQIEEILVGKTGTLTKAQMRVSNFVVEGTARVNSRKNTVTNCEIDEYNLTKLKESILFNSTARIEPGETDYVARGSPVDTCLINFLQDANIPAHLMVQRKFGKRELASRGFSQKHRTSAIAVENFDVKEDDEKKVTIYLKGAPEEVIKASAMMQMHDLEAPNDNHKTTSLDQVTKFAKDGYKVVCFSFCEITKDEWDALIELEEGDTRDDLNKKFANALEGGLDFRLLATFALRDGLRPHAASFVNYARGETTAGLRVRLISNDHVETAKAVARRAGILSKAEALADEVNDLLDKDPSGHVMLGDDFAKKVGGSKTLQTVTKSSVQCEYEELEDMEAFSAIAKDLRVLARATAEHKKLFVIGLKALAVSDLLADYEDPSAEASEEDKKAALKKRLLEAQCKVSVTGEGISDVDALKEAQVGLAMGTSCPAAKDASQLVIMDNNFKGCLAAVLWGRNIFQNVTRFLQFQLTCNLAMVLTIAIGMFFFGESPFSAAQLLWINTIMDVLGALALATEPPLASGVKGDPRQQTSVLEKNKHVWRQIIGVGLYEAIIMLLLFCFGGLACGSPVWSPYVDTKFFRKRPDPWSAPTADGAFVAVECPQYPNDPLAENFGYSQAALEHVDCRDYIAAAAKITVMTYAFNTFCFMNLFNLINCRKVGADERAVFESFWTHNPLFLMCIFGAFACQMLLVEYASALLRTTSSIGRSEWGAAFAMSASVLAAAFLLKLTPKAWVEMIPTDRFGVDENKDAGGMAQSAVGAYRRVTQAQVEVPTDLAAVAEATEDEHPAAVEEGETEAVDQEEGAEEEQEEQNDEEKQ